MMKKNLLLLLLLYSMCAVVVIQRHELQTVFLLLLRSQEFLESFFLKLQLILVLPLVVLVEARSKRQWRLHKRP
jgi:Ni/Fe-hydrogenase subunit HybB-like protein